MRPEDEVNTTEENLEPEEPDGGDVNGADLTEIDEAGVDKGEEPF